MITALHRACLALFAFTGCGLTAQLHAQAYPTRPVRMIIPFSPGGATDVPGRILAQKLSEVFGQQVVVDNRPGAGSTIGTDIAAKSPADGYTLLLTATPFVIGADLYKKLPYDPLKDFAPVMQIGSAPNVLVVHPSLPAKSVKDLIALARAQPGRIDFASSGNGSAQHLFGVLFMSLAKIKLTNIPYKGSAPATTDLISGQVSVGFPGIAIALPHSRVGRLRALAVTSAQRSPQMPDVPSIAEAGVSGYAATLWLGLAAPQGTPKVIIERLNAEITKVLQSPDVRNGFRSAGTDVVASTPEAFGDFIRSEYAKWVRVVQESGAQVN